MAEENNRADIDSLRLLISLVPKFAIGTTALSFTIGLLIVNLRLAWYGVQSSEFGRTEYVLAGALFLFLAAIANLSISKAVAEYNKGIHLWRTHERKRGGAYVFGAVMTLFSLWSTGFMYLSGFRLTFYTFDFWMTMGALAMTGYFTKQFFVSAIAIWRQTTSNETSTLTPDLWHGSLHWTLLRIPLFVGMLAIYSFATYPYLTPAVGGGRKDQVLLVPKEQHEKFARALGLPVDECHGTIGPFDLLTETDKEIVVLLPMKNKDDKRRRAIRIGRDMIEAIQNIEPKLAQ